MEGFWGPPTATIDWCEPNYVVTKYIAEFWNTWSNLCFIVFGLYGLMRSIQLKCETRFHLIYLNIVVIGIGSSMFHGTLTLVSQQCDETPMIWSMLIWFYILYSPLWEQNATANTVVVLVLVLLGSFFAVLHSIYRFTTAFQFLFAILVLLCLPRLYWYYSKTSDARARKLLVAYLSSILIGTAFWLVDFHYCDSPFNFYGHVWWHCFMSINAYTGPLFMQFVRVNSQGGAVARVETHWTGVPTIVVVPNARKAQ